MPWVRLRRRRGLKSEPKVGRTGSLRDIMAENSLNPWSRRKRLLRPYESQRGRRVPNKSMSDDAQPLNIGDRRFELLVRAITDYAIYMLNPDGSIASWNAGAERLKGYTEAEVLGRHFSQFFTPEDRATNKPWNALKIAGETGRWEDEGWRVRKDGTRFWALAVLDAIRDPDGTTDRLR